MTRTLLLAVLLGALSACTTDPHLEADAATSAPDAGVALVDAPAIATPDAPGLDAPGLDAWTADAWSADDAGSPDAHVEPGTDADSRDAPTARAEPVQLTITVHLEAGTSPGETPYTAAWWDVFDGLVAIFEAHGARLTLEPRVEALAGVGAARLTAHRARGHEVGVHAVTGTERGATYDTFVRDLRVRGEAVETAVGPIEHTSGNCAAFDWVGGVAETGYGFTTAATVYCLLAIPAAERPPEYRTLTCPGGALDPVCHRAYPDTSEGTVHAWRARSGATWLTDDPTGGVVILPSRGTLDCILEEMRGVMGGACTLADDDIAVALAELDEAVRVRDPSRPAQQYWVWSYGRALDPAALERFLDAVDERVARGEVEWATANDAYHSFVAWEETHR